MGSESRLLEELLAGDKIGSEIDMPKTSRVRAARSLTDAGFIERDGDYYRLTKSGRQRAFNEASEQLSSEETKEIAHEVEVSLLESNWAYAGFLVCLGFISFGLTYSLMLITRFIPS